MSNQLSEDEISPDGASLNQDQFMIRRARLRVDRYFSHGQASLELDANTVAGPYSGVRFVDQ